MRSRILPLLDAREICAEVLDGCPNPVLAVVRVRWDKRARRRLRKLRHARKARRVRDVLEVRGGIRTWREIFEERALALNGIPASEALRAAGKKGVAEARDRVVVVHITAPWFQTPEALHDAPSGRSDAEFSPSSDHSSTHPASLCPEAP